MRRRRPRLRRTAEEARAAILDAAEKRLAEVGPAGIRLQDVAHEVGVSHPTVLHHFGSREGLVHAVVERNIGALERDLIAEIGKEPMGTEPVTNMLDCVARVLDKGGHARVVAWLALSGERQHIAPNGFEAVARAAHQLRTLRRGADVPPYEDTYFTMLLAGLALFGDAIAGGPLRGEQNGEETSAKFRSWLAVVLKAHLERGGS